MKKGDYSLWAYLAVLFSFFLADMLYFKMSVWLYALLVAVWGAIYAAYLIFSFSRGPHDRWGGL